MQQRCVLLPQGGCSGPEELELLPPSVAPADVLEQVGPIAAARRLASPVGGCDSAAAAAAKPSPPWLTVPPLHTHRRTATAPASAAAPICTSGTTPRLDGSATHSPRPSPRPASAATRCCRCRSPTRPSCACESRSSWAATCGASSGGWLAPGAAQLLLLLLLLAPAMPQPLTASRSSSARRRSSGVGTTRCSGCCAGTRSRSLLRLLLSPLLSWWALLQRKLRLPCRQRPPRLGTTTLPPRRWQALCSCSRHGVPAACRRRRWTTRLPASASPAGSCCMR